MVCPTLEARMGKVIDFGRRRDTRSGSDAWLRQRRLRGHPTGSRYPHRGSWFGRYYGLTALFVFMCLALSIQMPPNFWTDMASLPDRVAGLGSKPVSHQFTLCRGARGTCVVDGDTIWLAGENIRIADINTPEVSDPQCAAEARLGERATRRLQRLLNAGPFQVRRGIRDEDIYGRKLRTLHRDGQSLGAILVAEGLAHEWRGYKESWCG
jgi:hypothetical protein